MKLLFQYLVMVVSVLAVLFVVLHVGGGLKAPPAIDGQWRLTNPSPDGCPAPALMTISQSGLFLDVQLGGTRQAGRFSADEVTTGSFRLHLKRDVQPYRLEGELRLAGCDKPVAVRFMHIQAEKKSTGGPH